MSVAIELDAVGKRYGDVVAVEALSLDLAHGEVYGLLGPNGAGKTTTLGMLTRLLRPTAGQVTIDGVRIKVGGGGQANVGFLPQAPAFHRWLTGRELLNFVGEVYGQPRTARHRRVSELLEQLDLTDAADRKIGGYSGGMRQRLGLAVALANDPDVLILDEPVSALDPIGRRQILELIRGFAGRKTVIMSSHVLDDISRVASRVGILDRGKLLVDAAIGELRDRFAEPLFDLEFDRPPHGLRQALIAVPWVQQVDGDGVVLSVSVSDQAAAMRELPALALSERASLVRYERREPTLEDIFVRIVEQSRA